MTRKIYKTSQTYLTIRWHFYRGLDGYKEMNLKYIHTAIDGNGEYVFCEEI